MAELVQYRELLKNLVLRDLKVRYRNSALGFLWSLGHPLLMMLVFTLVFTIMMPNNQIRYFPLFILIGLLPWNFCSASVTGGVRSLVSHEALIKKAYFPRALIPMGTVLANTVHFLLALIVLFAMVAFYRIGVKPLVLWLPLVILLQLCFLVGLALFLSSLNVLLRDTEVIVEVLVLAWFFLTPVFYDIYQLFPQWGRLMYVLNPMASFISTYRLILMYGAPPDPFFVSRTAVTALATLAFGYWFFRRLEPRLAEEL
ncbi:MAG: ABC transporter permease [Chloroflexi bacterium]|nr:ABC transporter permease [Chloroflexota bacterium]